MLELEDLARRFGDVVALDGVSFSVEPGQLFGFVGPNGAGKTTTMRIVLGVLAADRGQVRWRGEPVDARRPARASATCRRSAGCTRRCACATSSCTSPACTAPMRPARRPRPTAGSSGSGSSERAGDRVEKLSLGNQQRVQLAAALVHDPELLVLDEPFSGLDPVGVDVLSGVLSEYASTGVPVVFSSHQLELVERLCEAVAIIKDGRLVATGRVEELRDEGAPERQVRVAVDAADDALAGRRSPPTSWTARRAGCWSALRDGATPEAVLDAARTAGTVTYFSLERPTLTDLFRRAVAA